MLLYFHSENEMNNFSLQVCFKFSWSFFDNSYFAELLSEAYLESNQTSRMELFAKIVDVTYFRKKPPS